MNRLRLSRIDGSTSSFLRVAESVSARMELLLLLLLLATEEVEGVAVSLFSGIEGCISEEAETFREITCF